MVPFILMCYLVFICDRLFGRKKEEKIAIDYKYIPNQSKVIINETAT